MRSTCHWIVPAPVPSNPRLNPAAGPIFPDIERKTGMLASSERTTQPKTLGRCAAVLRWHRKATANRPRRALGELGFCRRGRIRIRYCGAVAFRFAHGVESAPNPFCAAFFGSSLNFVILPFFIWFRSSCGNDPDDAYRPGLCRSQTASHPPRLPPVERRESLEKAAQMS